MKQRRLRKPRPDPRLEASLSGPRAYKKPGEVDWAWQTVGALKSIWQRHQWIDQDFEKFLGEIKKHKVWEVIPPAKPYGSLDALLKAEIGETEDGARERTANRLRLVKPLNPQGVNNLGRDYNHVRGSTGADYLLARIKRDHPEIAARVEAGEFKSARSAAIEAGIIKSDKVVTVPLDPAKAAVALRRRFSDVQWRTFLKEAKKA